jgi:hypothetical protein
MPSRNQPQGLISVLADRTAEIGDRHDAAMDLSAFDAPEVEAVLIAVSCDETEDPNLIDAAGESLWQIWKRNGNVSALVVSQLRPEARKFFEA